MLNDCLDAWTFSDISSMDHESDNNVVVEEYLNVAMGGQPHIVMMNLAF